jgi:hypothetical protein
LPLQVTALEAGVQQIVPPSQIPPAQSPFAVQPLPSAQALQVGPPQSTSVSLPFWTVSVHDATHVVPLQIPPRQSAAILQPLLNAHGFPLPSQATPPQSTSVSRPFFTASLHVGAVHVWALGSQTLSMQSAATRHFFVSAHGAQLPPQSTSVSFPPFMPSRQLFVTQRSA